MKLQQTFARKQRRLIFLFLCKVKRTWQLMVILPLMLVSPISFALPDRYVDSHVHLVDFFQDSEGIPALVESMNQGQISHSVVMGIPVAKQWHENEPQRPRYYAGDDAPVYWYSATDFLVYDAVMQAKPEDQARLIPFITGFNPNDKNSAKYIRQLIERHPGFWQGIGEVFTRHDDLTALMMDVPPRANNEAMMKVYQVAEDYQLPVVLHSNITSKRERHSLYEEELTDALKAYPKVNFIWAHAGTSQAIHRQQGHLAFLYDLVAELLADYPNLYIDISWTMLDEYLLTEKGQPDPKWLALVGQYPDRFIVGSDVVGKFGSQSKIINDFETFLSALPASVAEKVASKNILDLLPDNRDEI